MMEWAPESARLNFDSHQSTRCCCWTKNRCNNWFHKLLELDCSSSCMTSFCTLFFFRTFFKFLYFFHREYFSINFLSQKFPLRNTRLSHLTHNFKLISTSSLLQMIFEISYKSRKPIKKENQKNHPSLHLLLLKTPEVPAKQRKYKIVAINSSKVDAAKKKMKKREYEAKATKLDWMASQSYCSIATIKRKRIV